MTGTATFAGEGPVSFQATLKENHQYDVKLQWGGDDAAWNADGVWTLGGMKAEPLVKIDVASADEGMTLVGTATFAGEGPVAIKATAK